jgi:hypothetical protein
VSKLRAGRTHRVGEEAQNHFFHEQCGAVGIDEAQLYQLCNV